MAKDTEPHAKLVGSRLARRYLIEELLGSGGTARVFRARDQFARQTVALKRHEHPGESALALFENEYRFLASTQHPRIIQVLDYGRDQFGAPFYTMELLAGASLYELAPLDWRMVCRVVRDVATSLALVHSKRALHRDVSPMNVRVDRERRAKLIDFGAITGFGPFTTLVGTPPFVAPEMVRGMPLDQRSDLYSLGATMYFALTGRPPYPCSRLSNLEYAWRTLPSAPSKVVPGIPPELDELVMSMISLDPVSRPTTAAHIIATITVVGGLGAEDQEEAAYAHLVSPPLIGRSEQMGVLTAELGGSGSCAITCVEGEAGMGRTRIARELMIEARVRGQSVVSLSAAQSAGTYAMVRDLVRHLVQSTPAETSADGGQLAHFFAGVAPSKRAPGSLARLERPTANERTLLIDWLRIVASEWPFVLILDDVHLADDESLGVLSELLTCDASPRPRLVATLDIGAVRSEGLSALLQGASRVGLTPFSVSEIDQLVEFTFGRISHQARVAQWLAEASNGNPGHCRSLLEHLVRRRTVGYAQGAWALPSELSDQDLPPSMVVATQEVLQRLSVPARDLARAISLSRRGLSLRVCRRLVCRSPEIEAWESAVDELMAERIVALRDARYRIGREPVRAIVLKSMSGAEEASTHAEVGQALLAVHGAAIATVAEGSLEGVSTDELHVVFEAGWHLAYRHDAALGMRLLRDSGMELAVRGEGLDVAIPAMEGALAETRRQGRSRYWEASLLVPLCLAALWGDWRLAYRHGDRALQLLREVTGLERASRWSGVLGRRPALLLSLVVSGVLFYVTPRRHAARSFKEAVTGLLGLGSCLAAVYSILLDVDRAQSVRGALKLLEALPRRSPGAVIARQIGFVAAALGSRFSAASVAGCGLINDLSRSLRGFPDRARVQVLAGIHATLGGIDSLRLDESVVGHCRALEATGVGPFRHTPTSLLARWYLARGEWERYEESREALDEFAARGASTWREDLLLARRLLGFHSITGDVVALRRIVEEMTPLSSQCPSLVGFVKAARASLLVARGELADAIRMLEELHRDVVLKYGVIFCDNAAVLPAALNRAGQHGRAQVIIQEIRATQDPGDTEYAVKFFDLDLQMALAHAGLGESARARALVEEALQSHAGHGNPLVRGRCHEVAALVELSGGNEQACRLQVDAMQHWYSVARCPALIAKRDNILRLVASRWPPREASHTRRQSDVLRRRFRAALASQADCGSLVVASLELILSRSGACAGSVYLVRNGSLCLAASKGRGGTQDRITTEAELCFASFSEGSEDDTATVTGVIEPGEPNCVHGFPLIVDDGGRRLVGVVVLVDSNGGTESSSPNPALLDEVANAVFKMAGQ